MYESFYGLAKKPFSSLPDPEFLYLSRKHEEVLGLIEESVASSTAGLMVIVGEAGTGKSVVLNHCMRNPQYPDIRAAYIPGTHLSTRAFLADLMTQLGCGRAGAEKLELLKELQAFLSDARRRQQRFCVFVDDAHCLQLETLEEIRMLSGTRSDNEPLVRFVLAGRLALVDKMDAYGLKQFSRKEAADCRLEALSLDEVRAYVGHRLSIAGAGAADLFDSGAVEAVFAASGGVPGIINHMCDAALVYGFAAEKQTISRKIVEVVAPDIENSGGSQDKNGERHFGAPQNLKRIIQDAQEYLNGAQPDTVPSASVKVQADSRLMKAVSRRADADGPVNRPAVPEPRPASRMLVRFAAAAAGLVFVGGLGAGALRMYGSELFSFAVGPPDIRERQAVVQATVTQPESSPAQPSAEPVSRLRKAGPPVLARQLQAYAAVLPAQHFFIVAGSDLRKSALWHRGPGGDRYVSAVVLGTDVRFAGLGLVITGARGSGRLFTGKALVEVSLAGVLQGADRIPPGTPIPVITAAVDNPTVQLQAEGAQALGGMLQFWLDAWQRKDLESYVACYANRITSYDYRTGNMEIGSRTKFQAHKKNMFARSGAISVSMSPPVCFVNPADPNKALAFFFQEYRSRVFADRGYKVFALKRAVGSINARGWKICGKMWIPAPQAQ